LIVDLPRDVPICLLASASWDTPAPVNVHHIARRFARRGHRVLFVETAGLRAPVPWLSRDLRRVGQRLRGWMRGVREAEDRLFVVSPMTIPGRPRSKLANASLRWAARSIHKALAARGMSAPVVWTFLPSWAPIVERLGARLILYHCVDDYTGNPGVDAGAIRALEATLLARADLVLASSPVLAERLRARGAGVRLVPNVADVALFSRAADGDLPEPAPLRGLPRPRLVYTGNMAAYRIDFGVLDALSTALPQASLVHVGAVGLGDTTAEPAPLRRLRTAPNVVFAGPQPHDELPAWLAHCDVGLVPFLDNAHTRGSMPLKLWEYLGAGLPVVTTDLPNFAGLAEQGIVRVARDRAGFVDAVRAALLEPDEAHPARIARARDHDWSDRVEELALLIAEALHGRQVRERETGRC